MTVSVVWWVVGGILALAFGIWAGLGYPGWYGRYDPGPSRRQRMGTWLNRWVFGGPRPRQFSTSHLVPPRLRPKEEARDGEDRETSDSENEETSHRAYE